jgi:hypothetical protein
MSKKELLKIFMELLDEWESAEDIVINDRDTSIECDEYEELEKRKKEYIKRFNKALLEDLD